jgi:hypothetical protein
MDTLEKDNVKAELIGKVTDKERVVEVEFGNKQMILP